MVRGEISVSVGSADSGSGGSLLMSASLTSAVSAVGGGVSFSAGSSVSGIGGEARLSGGLSDSSTGGALTVISGSSSSGSGGEINIGRIIIIRCWRNVEIAIWGWWSNRRRCANIRRHRRYIWG